MAMNMKNSANLATLFRTCLIFAVIYFLNINSPLLTIFGTALLIFAAILDGADGYLARKYCNNNKFGSLIDTLGDRITENLLLIFFAYKQLIPVWIPLIFVARSFLSDFVRLICFMDGVGTFEINRSKLGFWFVASKTSRAGYLIFKMSIFLIGAITLCMIASTAGQGGDNAGLLPYLRCILFYSSWILVFFNLTRFALLVYDSRSILRRELVD